jgi:anthranilate/para-aminobenzoate synthase component I
MVKPTTVKPTTVKPTTVKPTTVKPTTVKPTTVKPTTVKKIAVKATKPQLKTVHQEFHSGPFRVAAAWPHQEMPLILSMMGGKQIVIATSFTPVSFDAIAQTSVNNWKSSATLFGPNVGADDLAELPRWIFAVPYETYAGGKNHAQEGSERPLAWEIKAALIWDEGSSEPRYIARTDCATSRFHLNYKPQIIALLAQAKKWEPPTLRPMTLHGSTSHDTYLDSAREIIEAIARGDFYQVNLLRYFSIAAAHGWDNLCARMESNSGPHGALLTAGSRVIASFSPERFIEVSIRDNKHHISTWPIKGTAPRDASDPLKDLASGAALSDSAKDQAELHMIIDLMRNDLSRICERGTVAVTQSGTLKKFKHVWHLEGEITGELIPAQNLEQILAALCPGGSITGAPKIAAMERIKNDEGQPRGFFMGNLFRINHDGSLQSNILIRTLVSNNWMTSANYAAGSGLVIKSSPEAELLEIQSKCSPVTSI